jgi:hypothetical protein
MEGKYDYDYGFTASVYIKWYSYSSWTFVGMVSTSSGCATKYTYPEEDYTFLSKLEFYYSCIQAP